MLVRHYTFPLSTSTNTPKRSTKLESISPRPRSGLKKAPRLILPSGLRLTACPITTAPPQITANMRSFLACRAAAAAAVGTHISSLQRL
jgi:hypothetical protein